jgi:hypothetical protein
VHPSPQPRRLQCMPQPLLRQKPSAASLVATNPQLYRSPAQAAAMTTSTAAKCMTATPLPPQRKLIKIPLDWSHDTLLMLSQYLQWTSRRLHASAVQVAINEGVS